MHYTKTGLGWGPISQQVLDNVYRIPMTGGVPQQSLGQPLQPHSGLGWGPINQQLLDTVYRMPMTQQNPGLGYIQHTGLGWGGRIPQQLLDRLNGKKPAKKAEPDETDNGVGQVTNAAVTANSNAPLLFGLLLGGLYLMGRRTA